MIKRVTKVLSMTLILLIPSSCFLNFSDTSGQTPYGIWKSEDPVLTLDINPDTYPYKGTYVIDGESVEVTIGGFSVYDFFEIWTLEDSGIDMTIYSNSYFNGTYKLKKDKIYYTLKPHWQEKTGYKTIIFEKMENYDNRVDEPPDLKIP